MALEAVSMETRSLYERVKYATAGQVARQISIFVGYDSQRAAAVMQELNRAALAHRLHGDRVPRRKLRALARLLGVA